MIHAFSKWLAYVLLRIFYHIEAYGVENIPKEGGFILASNHLRYLDPRAVSSILRRNLSSMAKSELFAIPLFGWYLKKIHAFPVKRASADINSLKEAMKRVRKGGGLLLFPEGGRRDASSHEEPHAGVGFLVNKLAVPVIPAAVFGSDKAWPRGAKFLKPSRIKVVYGKKINIEKGLSHQDVARLVMSNIRQISLPR